MYADFEADNGIKKSNIGNKTTYLYRQNPVLNGYHILSELDDILQNGYHKSPLRYHNGGWCVDEVIKIGSKMAFYFKNTNKYIVMTEENEEDY